MRRALLAACLLAACAADRGEELAGAVYVVPFGAVDDAELARAESALSAETGRPAHRLPPRPLPTGGDAGAALDVLLLAAPPDAFRVLGVAAGPLSSAEHSTVIGYARIGERALVYSAAALPLAGSEARRRARVRRVVAHELGHTHGGSHCESECLLQSAHTAGDVDRLPDAYCAEHAAQAARALRARPDEPGWRAALALERLRLGRLGEAVGHLRDALRDRPDDARLLTTLGVALLARGDLVSADAALAAAVRLDPRAAPALYARAVLAAGPAPGLAAQLLEAAVVRDPDERRAHRAAGIAWQDLLADADRAVVHYERHLSLGGDDPDVRARLGALRAATTVVFLEPEVVLPRSPGR